MTGTISNMVPGDSSAGAPMTARPTLKDANSTSYLTSTAPTADTTFKTASGVTLASSSGSETGGQSEPQRGRSATSRNRRCRLVTGQRPGSAHASRSRSRCAASEYSGIAQLITRR